MCVPIPQICLNIVSQWFWICSKCLSQLEISQFNTVFADLDPCVSFFISSSCLSISLASISGGIFLYCLVILSSPSYFCITITWATKRFWLAQVTLAVQSIVHMMTQNKHHLSWWQFFISLNRRWNYSECPDYHFIFIWIFSSFFTSLVLIVTIT